MTRSRPADVRITRRLAFLMSALPIILLLGAMIVAVVTLPGETTLVGRRGGPWRSVPTWQVQTGALAILLPLAYVILWRSLVTLVSLSEAMLARRRQRVATNGLTNGLAPGELIQWQGRQGWRGITVGRLSLMGLAAIGPALFTMAMGKLWTGPDELFLKLFWTVGALAIFGGSIFMAILYGPAAVRRFSRDLLSTMIVTDRRLAWRSPFSRELYREVSGADIVSAFLVEGDDKRGWIGIVRRHGGTVEEIDLRGVPRPTLAVSALSRLARP